MRAVENTNNRLVLVGASPLFRPFFLGGLGFLVLGVGLLVVGVLAGGSLPGDGSPTRPAGMGVFLATFGFCVAMVPLVGRFPYRREIVVDRAADRLVRRDRTLLRLRQDAYALGEIRTVAVEEARHVDGDPYFSLLLRLESGDSVTLDRFADRPAADLAARLIRDHLGPEPSAAPGHPRPPGP